MQYSTQYPFSFETLLKLGVAIRELYPWVTFGTRIMVVPYEKRVQRYALAKPIYKEPLIVSMKNLADAMFAPDTLEAVIRKYYFIDFGFYKTWEVGANEEADTVIFRMVDLDKCG